MYKAMLANELTALYESPEPGRIFAYMPGLAALESGWLIATMGQGGLRVVDLPSLKRNPRGRVSCLAGHPVDFRR